MHVRNVNRLTILDSKVAPRAERVNIVGSLRDREVTCSVSDLRLPGFELSNFVKCPSDISQAEAKRLIPLEI